VNHPNARAHAVASLTQAPTSEAMGLPWKSIICRFKSLTQIQLCITQKVFTDMRMQTGKREEQNFFGAVFNT